jgi:hypothetical protein
MVVNIEMFTASFEDIQKISSVLKVLFQKSKPMRKLFHKHGELILTVLIEKYENLRKSKNSLKENAERLELDNQSVNIGEIIRLYAELGSMSSWFQDFSLISRFYVIMSSKRSTFMMQYDAYSTLYAIFFGRKNYSNDSFTSWIEDSKENQEILSQLFRVQLKCKSYFAKRQTL